MAEGQVDCKAKTELKMYTAAAMHASETWGCHWPLPLTQGTWPTQVGHQVHNSTPVRPWL